MVILKILMINVSIIGQAKIVLLKDAIIASQWMNAKFVEMDIHLMGLLASLSVKFSNVSLVQVKVLAWHAIMDILWLMAIKIVHLLPIQLKMIVQLLMQNAQLAI